MRLGLTKEWYERQAQVDAAEEVAAGRANLDEVLGSENRRAGVGNGAPLAAFRSLIRLKRRARRLSPEKLAEQAAIELEVLLAIEQGGDWNPEPRTVLQLGDTLDLPVDRLLELAGLTEPRNHRVANAAARFTARSASTAELAPEERDALDEFVKELTA